VRRVGCKGGVTKKGVQRVGCKGEVTKKDVRCNWSA